MSMPFENDKEFLSQQISGIIKLKLDCNSMLSAKELDRIDDKIKKIEISLDKVHYLRSLLAESSRRISQHTFWSIAVLLGLLTSMLIWNFYISVFFNFSPHIVLLLTVVVCAIACSLIFQNFLHNQATSDTLHRLLEFETIELRAQSDWRLVIKGFSNYSLTVTGVSLTELFQLERQFILETLRCGEACAALETAGHKSHAEKTLKQLEEYAPSSTVRTVEIPLELELPSELKYHYC